jgi:hypothetical protein
LRRPRARDIDRVDEDLLPSCEREPEVISDQIMISTIKKFYFIKYSISILIFCL